MTALFVVVPFLSAALTILIIVSTSLVPMPGLAIVISITGGMLAVSVMMSMMF